MSCDYVVIGGGPSGLLHALAAADAGRTVTVLEAADHAGGAVSDIVLDGVRLNGGAESYAIGTGAMVEWIEALGLSDQVASPQGNASWIHSNHGPFPIPGTSLWGIPTEPLNDDVKRAVGRWGALRAWGDALLPGGYGAKPGISTYDYVSKRMGKRVADRLLVPLITGVHSADPRTLELEALVPGLIDSVKQYGSLRRGARAVLDKRRAANQSAKTAGAAVGATVPTMSTLIDGLVDALKQRGGTLETGVRVSSIRRVDSGGWTVLADDGRSFDTATLAVATDPDTARNLLSEPAPEVARHIPEAPASPVRLVAMSVVSLKLARNPRGNGVLVPPDTRGVRAKAMTHLSAKWEHIEREASKVSDRAFVRLSYSPVDGELPDPALFPVQAVQDLAAMTGVDATEIEVRDWLIQDWPATQRRRLPGHAESLATLSIALSEDPTLELTGSWRAGTGLDAIARFAKTTHVPPSPTDSRN